MKKQFKFNCCKFCDNKNNAEICDVCNEQNYFENLKTYLPIRTILGNRYIIDKIVFINSEAVTYLAYDKDSNKKHLIKEYFPQDIASRKNNVVLALHKKEAQYKALMIDFIDLNQFLLNFYLASKSKHIIPIKEILTANNTVYVIKEYLDLISLEQYLNNTPGGSLSWYKHKPMFFQISDLVSNLHQHGIIHRGISPYNIFLDESHNIYVDGFSISCVRTAQSELFAELYEGFSAPEQYQTNGWQGTWTDVYSLASTLYTMLTGQILSTINSDSNKILKKNKVLMPQEVALAIDKATSIDHKQRLQTVEQFVAQLTYNDFSTNTTVYNTSDFKTSDNFRTPQKKGAERNQMKHLQNKKSSNRKSKLLVVFCVLTLFVALIFCIPKMMNFVKNNSTTKKIDDEYIQKNSWLFDDTASSESPTNNQTLGNSVSKKSKITTLPNFVGENVNDIINDTSYVEKINFIIEKEFSESNENEIIHQDPLPGVALKNSKINVVLKISKGPEYIEVPNIVGVPINEAEELLKSLDIQYKIVEVYDKNYKSDVINAVNKQPGEKIIKNKDVLILRIKSSQLNQSDGTVEPASAEQSPLSNETSN